MKCKAIFAVIAIVIVAAIIFAVIKFASSPAGTPSQSGKLKIQGFNSKGICAALMPACGHCPGEERDGNCFVTQAEFDEYKKQYPELKADN